MTACLSQNTTCRGPDASSSQPDLNRRLAGGTAFVLHTPSSPHDPRNFASSFPTSQAYTPSYFFDEETLFSN